MNIKTFLKERDAPFAEILHNATYDANRLAQAVHVSGYEVAKTVLLRVDHGYAYLVAVLPATHHINLAAVSFTLGKSRVELANEHEVAEHCPDCEFGVLPPFGSQYGMQTLVDSSLAEDDEIVFEGNTHEQAIRMSFEDFRRIECPLIGSFAIKDN